MVWPLLLLEELEGDWLEVDDDGMLDEDWLLREDGDWLLELVDGEALAEAPESLEVELVVLDGLPELPMELDDDGVALEVDDGEAFEALEPDWPHLSIAAWVFGPRMPSIGPGLQPCAFSCCCCSFTDSLPCALAPEVDADALVEALSSVELDGDCELADELDGDWDLDADCDLDGDCELVDDEAAGWFALEDCDWAYAEPAASSAAMAMASFLEVIGYSFPVRVGRWAEHGQSRSGAVRGPRECICKRCARVGRAIHGVGNAASPRSDTRA